MTTQTEALKMAIKEMTDAIPHLDIHFDDYFEAINACKEALQSQEQENEASSLREPVAWIKSIELLYMKAYKENIMTWKTNLGLKPEPDDSPLYTHPKEWQELSDEEVISIYGHYEKVDWEKVNAIMDKMKEKNT